jgi:phosphoglycerate dehydrogenase-like enzyme
MAMRERTPFPRALLERLPRLRMLITAGMRNASNDVAAATERGVVVCGTAGLPYPTAELTWGLILALFRRIPAEDRATREGRWQTSLGLGLNGKTLSVLGLGSLGSRVAKVGLALEMTVLAWSQNLTAARAAEVGVTLVGKDELLSRADVLTVHLVLGVGERTPAVVAELRHRSRDTVVARRHGAALAGGDDLARVKGEAPHRTEAAAGSPTALRAERTARRI